MSLWILQRGFLLSSIILGPITHPVASLRYLPPPYIRNTRSKTNTAPKYCSRRPTTNDTPLKKHHHDVLAIARVFSGASATGPILFPPHGARWTDFETRKLTPKSRPKHISSDGRRFVMGIRNGGRHGHGRTHLRTFGVSFQVVEPRRRNSERPWTPRRFRISVLARANAFSSKSPPSPFSCHPSHRTVRQVKRSYTAAV